VGKDKRSFYMRKLRHASKDIVKNAFHYSGITGLLLKAMKFYRGPVFLALTYHRIYPSSSPYKYLGISQDVFESHMNFVSRNFKIVSMREGIDMLYGSAKKEIYVAVNLDDGYADNYYNAFPVLKKYKVPATIFLTTDFIGKSHAFWWDMVFDIVSSVKASWPENSMETDCINEMLRNKPEDEIESFIQDMAKSCGYKENYMSYPMLEWAEIKEMSNFGINFEAHTKTHKNLCLLRDREAMEELIGSRKAIEDGLGKEVVGFSYPFGMFDERIKGMVKEAGFKYARACIKGFNYKESDLFSLACIGAGSILKPSSLAARLSFSLFKCPASHGGI